MKVADGLLLPPFGHNSRRRRSCVRGALTTVMGGETLAPPSPVRSEHPTIARLIAQAAEASPIVRREIAAITDANGLVSCPRRLLQTRRIARVVINSADGTHVTLGYGMAGS